MIIFQDEGSDDAAMDNDEGSDDAAM